MTLSILFDNLLPVGNTCSMTTSTLPHGLPARLAHLRQAAGITVADLAHRAGITRQTVYNIEAGKRPPGSIILRAIAEVLGISTDDLLGPSPVWPGR